MSLPLAWQQTQGGKKAALDTPIFFDHGAGLIRCGDGGWGIRTKSRRGKAGNRFLHLMLQVLNLYYKRY
jgi:hypothetical protein